MALSEKDFLTILDSEYSPEVTFGSPEGINDRPEPEVSVSPGGAFGRAVERGTDTMQATMYGALNAIGALTGLDGLEQIGEEGVRRNLAEAALNPAQVESWDDATESFGAFGTKVLETVGEQIPNLAVMIAGGGVGGGLTKVAVSSFGKSFAKKLATQRLGAEASTEAVEALAKQIAGKSVKRGAVGGAAAVNYPMQAGEVQMDLQQRGIDAPGTALLAGIPRAALDVYGLDKMVSTVFKGFNKEMAYSIADQVGTALKEKGLLSAGGVAALNLVKQAGKGMATGVAVEAPTEAAQELIGLAAIKAHDPSFDIFSPEGIARIKEAAISGGVVGGVFSGVGRGTSAALNTTYEMLARGVPQPEQTDQTGQPGSTEQPQNPPSSSAAPPPPTSATGPEAAPPNQAPANLGPTGTVPETKEQLAAQIQGYVRGERSMVFADYDANDPLVQELASDYGMVATPSPKGGVWLHTAQQQETADKVTALERRANPQQLETLRARAMGMPQSKADIDPNANPRIRETVGSTGQVIQQTLVDDNAGRPAANQVDKPVQETLAERVPQNVIDPWALPTTTQPQTQQPQRQEPGAAPAPVEVWYGSDQNAELSNLAERPFKDENGRQYRSVEHAYQSWKSGAFDQETYDKYANAKPGTKIVGRKGTKTDGDWNIALMERLVRQSFIQNPQAAQRLAGTGDAPITHSRDRGVWKTAFPAILTKVRDELRAGQTAQPQTQQPQRQEPTPDQQQEGERGTTTITPEGASSWGPQEWQGLRYRQSVYVEDEGKTYHTLRPAKEAFDEVQSQIGALTALMRCMRK